MQLEFNFSHDFENNNVVKTLVWLKHYRWTALFDWKLDSKLERSRRIVRKAFPTGISQADFMRTTRT